MAAPLPPLTDWTVEVGVVTTVHGLRGEVRVRSLSEVPDRFAVGNTVCAVYPDGRREELVVAHCRPHGGALLILFEAFASRDDAERLRGVTLTIAPSMRRELPPGRYYHDQLLGLSVVTVTGRDLGTVTEILETPAHDVFVTARALIPAVRRLVREIDLEQGRIVVEDGSGLETAPCETG